MRSRLYHIVLKIGVLSFAMLILFTRTHAQQRTQFTQYMFNGLVINPAYAGADEALSLTFVQRSQWTSVAGAPSTQTFAGHTLFSQKKIGVGLTLVNDRIGVHKNMTAVSNYAYHVKVGSSSTLSMGLQLGVHNQKSDYSLLTGSGVNDPKVGDNSFSRTFLDFGAGMYFRSKRLHLGLSAPSLLPERFIMNDSVEIHLNKVNFLFFSKYKIPLSEKIDFEPSVLLKYLAGVPVSFDINTNFVYRKVLTAGVSYRKSESFDVLLKMQLTPQLQFGYSYDHPIGIISSLSNSSHEVMVNYLFRYTQRNVTSPR